MRPVPGHPSDHPHYVVPTKAQLVRHVRQRHPFGESAEDERTLAKWSAAELKEIHRQLHEGTDQ